MSGGKGGQKLAKKVLFLQSPSMTLCGRKKGRSRKKAGHSKSPPQRESAFFSTAGKERKPVKEKKRNRLSPTPRRRDHDSFHSKRVLPPSTDPEEKSIPASKTRPPPEEKAAPKNPPTRQGGGEGTAKQGGKIGSESTPKGPRPFQRKKQ